MKCYIITFIQITEFELRSCPSLRIPNNIVNFCCSCAYSICRSNPSSSIPVQTMDTIQVQAHPLVQTAADFAVADQVVDQKALSERATTIGDALADELGVYSNQYGSGSSRPVIRGQDGPRVKVLQHASETADVST